MVTLNQPNADYTVMLNRESKHNRGLLRTNSQIQVANRLGDILGSSATRTVGNASKDACQLILTDWSQHGRIAVPDSPTSAPAAVPLSPAPAPNPAKADASMNESYPARSAGEATAEISSEPSGADIEIDGKFVGSTPSSVGILAGEHTLGVSKNGYKRWERALKSSTGNIKITAVLEPIPPSAVGTVRASDEIHRDPNPTPRNESSPSVPAVPVSKDDSHPAIVAAISTTRDPVVSADSSTGPSEESLIGVWFTGNPTVRHDGVEISGVRPKGPADNIDIKPGDVILAIDGHYLFTIDELRAELLRHGPGARLTIRYRHNRLISENYLTLGSRDAAPGR